MDGRCIVMANGVFKILKGPGVASRGQSAAFFNYTHRCRRPAYEATSTPQPLGSITAVSGYGIAFAGDDS